MQQTFSFEYQTPGNVWFITIKQTHDTPWANITLKGNNKKTDGLKVGFNPRKDRWARTKAVEWLQDNEPDLVKLLRDTLVKERQHEVAGTSPLDEPLDIAEAIEHWARTAPVRHPMKDKHGNWNQPWREERLAEIDLNKRSNAAYRERMNALAGSKGFNGAYMDENVFIACTLAEIIEFWDNQSEVEKEWDAHKEAKDWPLIKDGVIEKARARERPADR